MRRSSFNFAILVPARRDSEQKQCRSCKHFEKQLCSNSLNKGEARNALARAVFLCRPGEISDRSFEQQRYRASGPHTHYRRNLEHRLLYRASRPCLRTKRPTRRSRTTQVPLPARLGAHRPHRRLPMEGQQASNGQVQVAALPKPALACFIVHFLTVPHSSRVGPVLRPSAFGTSFLVVSSCPHLSDGPSGLLEFVSETVTTSMMLNRMSARFLAKCLGECVHNSLDFERMLNHSTQALGRRDAENTLEVAGQVALIREAQR